MPFAHFSSLASGRDYVHLLPRWLDEQGKESELPTYFTITTYSDIIINTRVKLWWGSPAMKFNSGVGFSQVIIVDSTSWAGNAFVVVSMGTCQPSESPS